jgi:glycosyltransferase involved in cell wall biosynthesis
VRPDDPEEMAEAWRRLQQIQPEEKQRFKKAARERIIEHYSLLRMIDQTSALLQELGR